MFVCFSHGRDSGPWGTNISALASVARERGLELDSLDYRGIPDEWERIGKLERDMASAPRPLVLAGSSMGGYVSAVASWRMKAHGLFLLAPAFYMQHCLEQSWRPAICPITIVHGWRDDVVPVEHSVQFAQEHHATLHIVDGDHRLVENLDEISQMFDWFLDIVLAD